MYSDRLAGASVCVVDMTHGGKDMCRALVRIGALPFAVDVHGTLVAADIAELSNLGIPVYADFSEAVSINPPDVVFIQYAPNREEVVSFCGDAGIPLLTHARATGLMLRDRLEGVHTAEITGARGKSTVMAMLSSIMAHAKQPSLFMTSTGAYIQNGPERVMIDAHGCITPAHALSVVDAADAAGLGYAYCFFEVSLGGLGVGDVASILDIPLELKAGIGSSAFYSKAQMAEFARPGTILNVSAGDDASRRMRFLTCAFANIVGNGPSSSLYSVPAVYYPHHQHIEFFLNDYCTMDGTRHSGSISIEPACGLFGSMASETMLAAVGLAVSLGISDEHIRAGLHSYTPLPRRMVYERADGVHHIKTGAVTREAAVLALEDAIRYSRDRGIPIHAIVGGRTKTSCGTMDVAGLADDINAMMDKVSSFHVAGQLGSDLKAAGCRASVIPMPAEQDLPLLGGFGTVVISCIN